MPDVKELKESIIALAVMFKAGKDLAADGVQWSDALALFDKYQNDQVFASKIDAGLQGLDKVSAELADLSLFEGLELLRVIREEFRKAA